MQKSNPVSPNILPPTYDNVVFITWDGVRAKFLNQFSDSGYLSAAQSILKDGDNYTVRILNHNSRTDSGLAALETGYGPDINLIAEPQFYSDSDKIAIPDGLTITERIKQEMGDTIKTGMVLPWGFHELPDWENDDMIQLGNTTDPIFENVVIGKDVDYWFASENVTWNIDVEETYTANLDPFVNKPPKVVGWTSPVLRASYIAEKAAGFINDNTNSKIYLRIHFTEPDHIAHVGGEAQFPFDTGNVSSTYLNALKESDNATQIIIDALKNNSIYENTLIILGTDHGIYGGEHDDDPYPNQSNIETVQTSFYMNRQLGLNEDEILADTQIAPIILSVLGINPSTLTPAFPDPLLWDFVGPSTSTSVTSTSTSSTTTTSTTTTTSSEKSDENDSNFNTLYLISGFTFLMLILNIKRRKI